MLLEMLDIMFKRVSRALDSKLELDRRTLGDTILNMHVDHSGVYLPTFESVTEGGSDFGLTGLGRGGQQVQKYSTS